MRLKSVLTQTTSEQGQQMADENANTADLTIVEKLDVILKRLGALESQGA